MKRKLFGLTLGFASILALASSGSNQKYVTKDINVYRNKGVVDKTFPVRFYEETPNIPYVEFNSYYKEFFGTEYNLTRDNDLYTYSSSTGDYITIDTKNDIMYSKDIDFLSSTAFLTPSNSKTYLNTTNLYQSTPTEKIVNLNDYHIDIHGDGKLYAPLNFLSSLSGGGLLYTVAYNTKDIYVIDYQNYLNNEEAHNPNYYGDDYLEPIFDLTVTRPSDLSLYSYGQLCFNFDIIRGYTAQLIFGDNNLVSLGLNGLLETYYPKIKECLLNENKKEYFFGYILLFAGLYDGGHTGALTNVQSLVERHDNFEQIYKDALTNYTTASTKKAMKQKIITAKTQLGFQMDATTGFYYRYDSESKTALIGFDSFFTDFASWDDFYNGKKTIDDIAFNKDTYAFIRKSFYQAKNDGAENLVLDIASNGGGNTAALCGIAALYTGGKGEYSENNIFNKTRTTEYFDVDINLDGQFNELDVAEANSFNFNYAVITSPISFSCGNALPSVLKEAGVKIVGLRSGGGSCAVSIASTADGLFYTKSNNHNFTNKSGDNFDSGVPLDHEIDVMGTDGKYDFTKLYTFNFKEYFDSLKNNQQ